jgi:hypothetical protein
MRVNSIVPTNFQAGVKIRCVENKEHKYLYNEVNNITREFKIPATFKTHEIELPSVSEKIIAKLNELGIKFNQK